MNKNNLSCDVLEKKTSINHFLLIMRTAIILLFTCVFISVAETGYTQNAKVTLNKSSVDLKEVLNEIESQTDYLFIYNNEVNTEKTVSVKTKNRTVRDVLTHVLKNSDIGFSMEGNHIILSYIEKQLIEKNEENTETVQQQGKTITGTIVDTNGETIIGANIIEKGTSNGTITDIDGNYTLNVKNNAIIIISYIGYKTENINTSGKSVINAKLFEDSAMLDEVVAIGYGTQQRSLVTSAISKLSIDESTQRQVQSASQLLDGRIAGVSTSTSSGNLGSGERMSIRGTASISAGNEPLYVIDGIPITNDNANLYNFGESMSSLATLNTADIESIVVLKDAASAAIYGSRATNGVIVITTKSGKEGRSDFQINVSTGLSKFPNIGKIKLADSKLYIKDYNTGVTNYNKQYGLSIGDSGYKVPISNPFGDLPDTNWMDLITQTGTMLNVDGSFSGGTQKTKYYIGANYNTAEGVIIHNKLDKVNLNTKVSHKFAPWLEVGANNLANYTKNYQVPGADTGSTVIGRTIEHRPFDRPYKPNGDYYVGGTDELTRHNILQILNEQDAYLENFRYIGNYYATLKYKDKLSWKYSFSADVNSTYDFTYFNENHPYGMGQGRLIDHNRLIKNFISENVVNYNETFKNITLNATLGHSFQKVTNRNASIDGRGFPSPSFSVGSVASEILGSTSMGVYAMESYFGRAILSYQDRYIISGTYRTDGSSKFAKDKRWGGFPSLSLGWNISNEKFMEGNTTDLKFRLSYGKTGNQVGIGRYAYQDLMLGGYNYRGESGIAINSFGNQDLTWERADQYDVGLDITLFKGRVNMMIDAYQKNTKDLLYSMPMHATSGVTSIISNIGTMRNRGLEFTLNTHFTFNKVEWLTQFNINSSVKI